MTSFYYTLYKANDVISNIIYYYTSLIKIIIMVIYRWKQATSHDKNTLARW